MAVPTEEQVSAARKLVLEGCAKAHPGWDSREPSDPNASDPNAWLALVQAAEELNQEGLIEWKPFRTTLGVQAFAARLTAAGLRRVQAGL